MWISITKQALTVNALMQKYEPRYDKANNDKSLRCPHEESLGP